jgi:sugar (pentulose or hexulose) kinase
VIVGLDVGTSVTKAAAFDADGRALAVEARPTHLLHPAQGRVEQDIDELCEAALGVLQRLCARLEETPQAIGVTGQGDGLWLLDADGAPVRHGLSWMDARAGAIVTRWIGDGTFDALYRASGNAPFPGAGAPLLLALAQEEPETLRRAATAARCKDVVVQHLTGVRATDLSDASNLFTDIAARRRDEALLDRTGLSDHARLLPPVTGEQLPRGGLRGEIARQLGLPEGLPVTAGPYDLPACAIGAGVTAPGDGLLIAGTTLACEVIVDRVEPAAEPAGQTLCVPSGALIGGGADPLVGAAAAAPTANHANRSPAASAAPERDPLWLRAMPAMTGTAALDWALRMVGAEHGELGDLLLASPPGARGVRVLPYLSSSGERAPFVAPDARGRIDGVELDTTKADVVRAFCEGLAYAARHCFEAAGLTGAVAVAGGGTATRAWLQVFADAIGRPLRIARGPEVGARGAALAAAAQLGIEADPAVWTASEETVEPDAHAAALAAERYGRYLEDVAAARGRWTSPAAAD